MTALRHCFDWLQLARASALPTALSNIMLGYLLATLSHAGVFRLGELISGMLVSACLYTAGMILNDVFDIEQDRVQRPQRPLPAGRIGVATARSIGISLLILGVVLASIISWKRGPSSPFEFLRPVVITSLLAIAIIAYDHWLKRTTLAPWLMGACRSLNLLLGASFAAPEINSPIALFGFEPILLAIAISLGLYVVGITFVARNEAVDNPSRFPIWLGTGLILLGIGGMMFSINWLSNVDRRDQKLVEAVPWIMLLLAFPVVRRSVNAALKGTKQAMQTAVVTGLRSIIVFDATLCFLTAPDRPGYALAVISLLIPSLILSRWLNPT